MMRIRKEQIPSNLESLSIIQNVENNKEYFAYGKVFDFVQNLAPDKITSQEEFKDQRSMWMLDELVICRLPLSEKIAPKELFFYCNIINNERPETWKYHFETMTIEEIKLDASELEDMFGWGINIWLFDHSEVSLNIKFNRTSNQLQFMESTNPLFLYFELDGYQYLFNYNGYT
ncbi:hypothetical protein N9355_05585 [Crocinitomicaceae bacterium]|nr:hypothetical protein [Crocinitomicaceae bacterium]